MKRVRLKPGVDPEWPYTGIKTGRISNHRVWVYWGGIQHREEYDCNLEELPNFIKGDVAFDNNKTPLGIVMLVHGDNIVVAISEKEIKTFNVSELYKGT